jgi:aspartyl-tRNA(Asn)/glutamyl-tRNA(Gln) amidotransferase subunit B
MKYETIIGLEVHIQNKTNSKMFCSCDAKYFDTAPNSHTCPVCLGLPGALPVPNKEAFELAILLSLALNCKINQETKFDRKNYSYPDLPKAFQISQYDQPVGEKGYMDVESAGGIKRINITRVHQEEDTAKSLHTGGETLVDFNKSGVGLLEIVTEPDFRSVEEVLSYARKLKQIAQYVDASDADMEKGQMRFELNMSLRPMGETEMPKYKVEVKNIGSISVLEKVIESEYARQSEILDNGSLPPQETRGLKDMGGETLSQRTKESEADYRYFPEPDIPLIVISDEWLAEIKKRLPELPEDRAKRYVSEYGITEYDAKVLTADQATAFYYEKLLSAGGDPKACANWMTGIVFAYLNKEGKSVEEISIKAEDLAFLIKEVADGKVLGGKAKEILTQALDENKDLRELYKNSGATIVSDDSVLEAFADEAIKANPQAVADFKAGKQNAVGFLTGAVMKLSKGSAQPQKVQEILRRKLKSMGA